MHINLSEMLIAWYPCYTPTELKRTKQQLRKSPNNVTYLKIVGY